MPRAIRVAEVTELPPGKGKVLELGGGLVTVFNVCGRFAARITRAHAGRPPSVELGPCRLPGRAFDVFVEDSPAELGADERPCGVEVRRGGVFILLRD
jgi:hypothetical protein